MAKANQSWIVHTHGELRPLQDNLYHVEGALPGMKLRRCMCVARLASGGLVIHNAVALNDEGMAKLDALGEVEYIVVPNGFHRLDSLNFRKRYPTAKLLCPDGSRKKIEEVVKVDGGYQDFPEDAAVRLEVLDGVNGTEGVMIVCSGAEASIVFNDTLFNIPKKGAGLVLRLLGSTGGPSVTRIARLFLVKDKAALRAHLQRLAETPGLCRLVPGHGELIDSEAAATLRGVAEAL